MKRAAVTLVSLVVLLVGLGEPSRGLAAHSAPAPLHFWDPNNDSVPGPEPAVDPSGSLWTSLELARLSDAVAAWTSNTTYDMTVVGTGEQDAYVDGREPACNPGFGYFSPGGQKYLALVCRKEDAKLYPGSSIGYYDIWDFDLYFHMNTGNPEEPDWWVGTTLSSEDRLHFQGIAMHELGHWIRLIDQPQGACTYTPTGFYTMCGTLTNGGRLDSWRQSTLHADDIASANVIY